VPRKAKRVRVERGLYRCGDIYWACSVPPGGTQAQWKKLGAVGIQEARRRRDEFAYKLRSGPIAATTTPRITMRELADAWFRDLEQLLAAGELRPRTITSYKEGIRLHVLPSLGSRVVSSIGPDDLVAWLESQRRAGAAAWSIRARWVPLRGMLGFAARSGFIPANPADLLTRRERPKLGRPRDRFFSDSEIQSLIAHARGPAALIVPLLLFEGLRVSELMGLNWEDVDFEKQTVRVRYQMSRKGQRVPLKTDAARRDVIMMDEIAHLLRKRRLAAPFSAVGDLIIANGVGNTLGYSRVRRAFAGAAASAGITDATPHTCRHTFASILIDQGCDVEFVSQQLGHSSTKTTWDTYVHLFRAREHAAAARRDLDAAFGRMLRTADSGPGSAGLSS
jgi:integrase